MIEAKNLTKCYGKHKAVSNLSFTAQKGKVLGFLGPNGAGKSTTMNMLTGYISATEGDVLVNGISMLDDPENAKKSIGYLPEIPPVYPDMTVTEYLKFVARLKHVQKKEINSMLTDVMGKTQITDVKGRLIKHLSKGYRQRVGLAGALIGYPEVLILDEPTVGLDPKQIIEIRNLIRELSAEHTIILSSHILSEISEICDDLLIINKGKMVAAGSPEELAKKAGNDSRIEIGAECCNEKATQILNSIDGIGEYQLTHELDDVAYYEIKDNGDKELCSKIFFAFSNADTALVKLYKREKDLESVFLEMTSEQMVSESEQPDAEQPKAVKPESEKMGAVKPESEQPESEQPKSVKPESEQPENETENSSEPTETENGGENQ